MAPPTRFKGALLESGLVGQQLPSRWRPSQMLPTGALVRRTSGAPRAINERSFGDDDTGPKGIENVFTSAVN
jgi:hypothetical protein